MTQRVLLCIMDGWGISKNHPEYDATKLAHPVHVDKLEKEYPTISIHADGQYVGLPEGQMGNSEVGHLNLGAGRVVHQDLSRINRAIKDGSFFKNERFLMAMNHAKENNSALHIFGLVSTGGVHSSLDHLLALIKMAADNGLKKVYVHAFLDGRDTPPQSACTFIQPVEDELKKYGLPPVATIIGRYYIMDRDNRWDRVEKGYNALLFGEGEHAATACEGVKASYARGDNDEFVLPTVIGGEESRIHDNDSIIFINFRPDRAREISKALNFKDFDGFERKKVLKNLCYITMTSYNEDFTFPVAFPKEHLVNILGDVLEANGIHQFRTAETEKYAHVTFFFNGGRETPYDAEERILVPSPKVATYDLKPEMSAYEVKDKLVEAIKTQKFDFIVVNYANGDMVGHTGIYEAIEKAVKAIDECVKDTVEAAKANDYEVIIIADHGNADHALNEDGTPNTAHSLNPVPFVYVTENKNAKVENGVLADVAPSILHILGMPQPADMTGRDLIK